MEINGKIHCLFEQSGTFKTQFKKLGFEAFDYDIQNNFSETDFVIDLFAEIEKAYTGAASVFDTFTSDDLLLAFFPCIYFCENNQLFFTGKNNNYQYHNLTEVEINKEILERAKKREYFYSILLKLFTICAIRNLRLIVENPYSINHYLHNNFPYKPAVIDKNRHLRGDYFKKPTQYFFHNCEPTQGQTYTTPRKILNIRTLTGNQGGGMCNESRSLISPEYARNFICDFVLGKVQKNTQLAINF